MAFTAIDISQLPRYVDISCVQAFHNRDDLDALVGAAVAGDFVSAHVLSSWVPYMRERLSGTNTLVGSPVGFPSGGAATQSKEFETRWLLDAGVQELDVVVNVGRLRSGDIDYVRDELATIVEIVQAAVPLRAILEVGHLSDKEIVAGAQAAVDAGVPWVKTGTGWSGRPTTEHHIKLIADTVGRNAEIKAAGGIRTLETVQRFIDLGVTRFGMNAGVASALSGEAVQARHA